MHQPEHPFGLRNVTQTVRAEVAKDGALGQLAVQLVDRRSREERLPARGKALQPRRPEEGTAVEAVVTLLDVAGDHGDPDPDTPDDAPVLLGDGALQRVG